MKRSGFEIETEAKRIKIAFDEMKKHQRPGQASGRGGKMDVMLAVKDEIVALIKEGYTPLQIANAMKTDTFSILPKSVTQLLNEAKGGGTSVKETKTEAKSKTKQATTKKSVQPKAGTESEPVNDGSFVPRKDRT
jgi:hypothetical protein